MTCATPNKRPIHHTEAMKLEVAMKIAKSLFKGGGFDSGDTVEEIAADIVKASDRCYDRDGYQLGRALEEACHWDVNSGIVEELQEFYPLCDDLLRAAEKQWGLENPMEPGLPNGTAVKIRNEVGTIIGLAEYSVASYAVKTPSTKNGYYVVRFEDAVVV